MYTVRTGRPASLGAVAIATNVALVGVVYIITRPGAAAFADFSDRVFGRYFTAGAILVLFVYGVAFAAVVGLAVVTTLLAWTKRESPKWVTWVATFATLLAPLVAVRLLRSA